MTPKRVLIVAPASPTMDQLLVQLRDVACLVEIATSAAESASLASHFLPDVVVIDDRIPGVTPVELMLRIRSVASPESPPVFMLAIPGEPHHPNAVLVEHDETEATNGVARIVDQIVGLLTASDADPAEPEQIHCQGLSLDRARHRVYVDGELLHLTPTEFKMLWELASRPGYVLSRTKLTKVCKGTVSAVQARTIDAHIKSIRRKLSDHAHLIETVHGLGYRFQETEVTVS